MADNELHIREIQDGVIVSGVVAIAAALITSEAAGQSGMGAHTGGRLAPTRDEIAQLAYFFYEARGRQDGHDNEDWLRAERQLFHHYA